MSLRSLTSFLLAIQLASLLNRGHLIPLIKKAKCNQIKVKKIKGSKIICKFLAQQLVRLNILLLLLLRFLFHLNFASNYKKIKLSKILCNSLAQLLVDFCPNLTRYFDSYNQKSSLFILDYNSLSFRLS